MANYVVPPDFHRMDWFGLGVVAFIWDLFLPGDLLTLLAMIFWVISLVATILHYRWWAKHRREVAEVEADLAEKEAAIYRRYGI